MRNILQVVKSGKPTYPVRLASERLLKAATDAGEITDQEAGEFETTKKDEAIERIHRTINSLGRNLGPAQNARRELDAYYGGALAERYNFGSREVCEAFGYFLLAVVTEGFEDSDTTGTQMGNYQGSWRGGGFE